MLDLTIQDNRQKDLKNLDLKTMLLDTGKLGGEGTEVKTNR